MIERPELGFGLMAEPTGARLDAFIDWKEIDWLESLRQPDSSKMQR